MSLLGSPYSLGVYKKRIACSDLNFPERAWKVRVINPPSIFSYAYELLKSTLSEGTRAKIDVLKSVDDLREFIDEDNIPEYLGGKMRYMGDPYCRFAIKGTNEYVRVPEGAPEAAEADPEYMLSPAKLKVNVAARNLYKDFRAVKAGVELKWGFELGNYDIDFSIKKFKNGGPPDGEVIAAMKRATLSPEENEHHGVIPKCTEDCTYEFIFDNSYSYLTSKDVTYTFDK